MPGNDRKMTTHSNGHPADEDVMQQDTHLLYSTRSEEVQEIMGRMPSWIIKWGITLMAIIIAGILIEAYLFKYPDIIPARVTIFSSNPPVKLVAKNNLPIQTLFVQNNQEVRQGDVLCVLANPAKYSDVTRTMQLIAPIDTATSMSAVCAAINLPAAVNLGELQSGYVALFQAVQAYRFFVDHNSYGDKINNLAEQSSYQQELSAELVKKDNRLKEQLSIQQSRFRSDSSLASQTVMSRLEYENARKDLLNQQMNTEGNYSSILQSKVQEKQIHENIAETSIQRQTDEYNFQEKIREAAKQLNGAYAQWEHNYVLRTPVTGKVSFFKYWKENQFVQAGEAVMIIIPPVRQYVARGDISLVGAGKIKQGQKVLIKLPAYPYEEFGSLSGIVASRSPVAMDSTFAIEINLENGLHTNMNKDIPPQPQMEGTAEIITENKSLLQRLFENVYGKQKR